ncbi:MAG: hypothetical protein M3277_08395 [Actinomycetota bacterium]|nr:hypothetical protein [Actinomycetota bacterium]
MRILVAVLVAIGVACSPASPPEAVPTFPPDAPIPPPEALIYVDRRSLKSYDLASGASELITELPSADVAVSPDGRLLAAVEESDPRGPGPEGFRAPQVVIAGTGADEIPSELGPGRAPEWAPNSAAVAVIEPTAHAETIAVYQLPGGKITTTAPGNESWSIVGWSGDEIVAIGARSGVVAIPTSTDEPRRVDAEPSQIWGVSPIASRHVVVGGRGGFISGSGPRRVVDVNAALGDGTWSLDGATIGVVFIEGPQTRLGLIDAASGQVRHVSAGRRAQGNVVWALDGKTFAFVRVDAERRGRLEAVVCSTATECTPAFSWDEGVRLLAFR